MVERLCKPSSWCHAQMSRSLAASLMKGRPAFAALVHRFGEHRGFVLTVQWDVLRSTAKRTTSDPFGTCLPRSVKDLMVWPGFTSSIPNWP